MPASALPSCLLVLLLALPACAEELTPEQKAAEQFRRYASNLQPNKDGSIGLIRVSRPNVKDADLAALSQFPHLRYLAIVGPQFTNAGLQAVSGLRELDTLFLSETSITSDGAKVIRGLPELQQLSLAGTRVDDRVGETLNTLPKLRSLSLEQTTTGDATAEQLSQVPGLEILFLDETALTDAGVKHLAKLPRLKLLSLSHCRLTGGTLPELHSLASLQHLILSSTGITDEGVKSLEGFTHLRTLELYQSRLSAQSVQQLRQKLPQTRVFYSPLEGPEKSRTPPGQLTFTSESTAPLRELLPPVELQLADAIVPDFQRHIVPLFGRLGCNSRNCHGSFQGRGGFRLSMFGYDFEQDWKNVRERIDLDKPADSLLLNHPTDAENHGGGRRLIPGSWQQALLRRWVETGATGRSEQPPTFARLEVTPGEKIFQQPGETRQLQVVAVWSDGIREDVTSLTRFETKDDAIATVSEEGLVTAQGRGDTHIIAFYDNGIVPTPILLPITDHTGERYPDVPAPTPLDQLVVAKLKKLGIIPSELCTDEEFLRRVSLDLIGTLPTPAEVLAFTADTTPDKRAKKIEELLQHPAHVAWWTTKLCDLTRSNGGYLGNTEMASVVAGQWEAWMKRRVQENVSWDQIVADIVLSRSRPIGQSYRDYIVEQSRFTGGENRQDYAALGNPMPHFWFRDDISVPSDKTLAFGYTFLGLRLDCAQCHKHPFDQWSQQDFERFTQFFTRIKTGLPEDALPVHDAFRDFLAVPEKLNTAALRRQSYLAIAAEGRAIPWREVYIEPPGDKPQSAQLPGASPLDLSQVADPRELLVEWMRTEPNRYLAKSFVNRIWANYFNVGLIAPTDDLNLANPPGNGPLLDWLVTEFIARDYDMQWLHRTIVSSRTYQLSWRPNESNRADTRHFSHAILRRLPAEPLMDAIIQATANSTQLVTLAKNVDPRKINQHPRSYQTRSIDYSLLVFGKTLRSSNCDCERSQSPTLPQALFLRNDEEILALLTRPDGWLAELRKQQPEQLQPDPLIREAYLRTLSRSPTAEELQDCQAHLQQTPDPLDGLHDILWALLNTQEFLANH